jgi:inosose dehydratase
MQMKIGTAPISWGVLLPSDPRQTPWTRYLDEVAAAGYAGTELGPYGYLPTDPTRLRKELHSRGMEIPAGYIFRHFEDVSLWPEIQKLALETGRLLAEVQARFLVLIDDTYTSLFSGEQYKPSQLDAESWKRLIDAVHKVADLVKDFGIQVVFHNHAETHVQSEEQILALLEQTDPCRVSLCFDTGHFAYRGGGDPVDFVRRQHQRIAYLHLKSIDREVWENAERENIPFATAVDTGVFAEPSRGSVDFVALRDVLCEINYQGWATVEQDVYPAPLDKPFPIAKRTREYLREIGFG